MNCFSKAPQAFACCILSPLHHCDVRSSPPSLVCFLLAHPPTGRRRRRHHPPRPTLATQLARQRALLSLLLSSTLPSSVANSSPSRSYDLISPQSTSHELMSLPSRAFGVCCRRSQNLTLFSQETRNLAHKHTNSCRPLLAPRNLPRRLHQDKGCQRPRCILLRPLPTHDHPRPTAYLAHFLGRSPSSHLCQHQRPRPQRSR